MPMRVWLISGCLCAISISTIALAATSIQEAIDAAISPDQSNDTRVSAANRLKEVWPDSVPLLLRNIDAYYKRVDGSPYSEDAIGKLIPLTQLLADVVANSDGSVQTFRDKESQATIDLLAAAAGDGERELRFNSSYILAKVVDDDNLCIILHRLRDPSLSYNGQVNLLQIAVTGTSNASRENVEAAKKTAELLIRGTEIETATLVYLLQQIASAREVDATPLPPDSYCAHYDVETGIASPGDLPPPQ